MCLWFLSNKRHFCPLFRLCVTNWRSEHQKRKEIKFYLDYDVIFRSHNCHVNAYTSKQYKKKIFEVKRTHTYAHMRTHTNEFSKFVYVYVHVVYSIIY